MNSSTTMKRKIFEKVYLDFFALRKEKIIQLLSDSGLNYSITYLTTISTRCHLETLENAYTPFFSEVVRVK